MINTEHSLSPTEVEQLDFTITQLGVPALTSPLSDVGFVNDDERISYFICGKTLTEQAAGSAGIPGFEAAGPRQLIYHDPAWVRAAIVTCGGLCPGINDVIKALVNTLYFSYGVDNIYGIQYGYRGLVPDYGLEPIELNPDVVDLIHENAGSMLGSSRGMQDVDKTVAMLDRLGINVLFTIGGDGTQRGARDIAEAAAKQGVRVSVIGIPKTIDNDLSFMDRTFGFETAVYASSPVISSAHDEAKGAFNGIGLIKLMGRDSGFIAACASLGNSVVNFCLVPEVPVKLKGKHGLFAALERRLAEKNHVVIVVAEGAGQDLMQGEVCKDASGNIKHNDIGQFLKEQISGHLAARGIDHSIKYFDPSYLIRSVPAHGTDAIFCLHLAENAVHAAMAGKTNMVVGYWHGQFTHVPIDLAVAERRKLNLQGQLWQSVLATTRQERYWQ
jgi:6-phosphofructokinase 1